MKHIIFLHYDGVLNTDYKQKLLMSHKKQYKDKYGACFDQKKTHEKTRN